MFGIDDGIAISAGAQLISGIAQYYNSQKAQGANQDVLNGIKAKFDALKPPGFNMAIDAPPQELQNTLSMPQFSAALQNPNYAAEKLSPQDYKQVGQMVPQFASMVRDQGPTTLQNNATTLAGKSAQMAALDRYKQIGGGEFDPQYQQQVLQAQQAAQQQAQAANQSILEGAQRRGAANSGLTMALQQAAAGQAMNQLANSNLGAANQAYQNRIGALASGAQLGGQMRNEDLSMQGQNANIINAFNQRMGQRQQDLNNQQAQTSNAAQQYNLGQQQQIANANTLNQNNFAIDNQKRNDMLAQQNYLNSQNQQGRSDRNAQQTYQDQANQLATNNQVAQDQYNAKFQQRQYSNSLLQNQYQDQLGLANAQAGVGGMQMGQNTNVAQGQNAGIQALGNVGSIFGMGVTNANRAQSDYSGAANRANQNQTGDWMTAPQQQNYGNPPAPKSNRYGQTGYNVAGDDWNDPNAFYPR